MFSCVFLSPFLLCYVFDSPLSSTNCSNGQFRIDLSIEIERQNTANRLQAEHDALVADIRASEDEMNLICL